MHAFLRRRGVGGYEGALSWLVASGVYFTTSSRRAQPAPLTYPLGVPVFSFPAVQSLRCRPASLVARVEHLLVSKRESEQDYRRRTLSRAKQWSPLLSFPLLAPPSPLLRDRNYEAMISCGTKAPPPGLPAYSVRCSGWVGAVSRLKQLT